jgi:ubiquinone/menaquinone biosynthesis C-methylase UbiE
VSQAKGREITFEKSMMLIEKYIKTKGKLLDVGTAGGSFLAVAKRNGWQVNGIEPNKWLCKWCKKHYGITIKQGTLEKNLFEKNSFDLVTLWDVLEHVSNPTDTLKRVNKLLKKNGALVVNYPDIDSAIAKLMRRKWFFILTVHLYYFTPKTIKKLLEKCGFKVVFLKKHWQTLSLGYLADRLKPYSRIGHKIATKTIKALRIDKMQIKYWLGQTFVIAKKVKEIN